MAKTLNSVQADDDKKRSVVLAIRTVSRKNKDSWNSVKQLKAEAMRAVIMMFHVDNVYPPTYRKTSVAIKLNTGNRCLDTMRFEECVNEWEAAGIKIVYTPQGRIFHVH
jgi:hypothetical protein